MAADPLEANPYAPPRARQTSREKRRPKRRAPGERVKWVYSAVTAVDAVAFFAIATGVAAGAGIQRELVAAVDGPLRWTLLLLGAVWIYFAWSGIPLLLRGGTSPSRAVLRLLVPVYSLYWVFAVNVLLCDAIDALLARIDDPRRAPKIIAVSATVVYFIPVVMLLTEAKRFAYLATILGHILWILYMFRCDALRGAVLKVRVQDRVEPVEPPVASTERDEYDDKLDEELKRLDGE